MSNHVVATNNCVCASDCPMIVRSLFQSWKGWAGVLARVCDLDACTPSNMPSPSESLLLSNKLCVRAPVHSLLRKVKELDIKHPSSPMVRPVCRHTHGVPLGSWADSWMRDDLMRLWYLNSHTPSCKDGEYCVKSDLVDDFNHN
jgi:hypothetical protein